ncbi:hypothetical protein [Chitiniphilus eburneus]|uniref:Uncharacterized protein n=1 Tax=Chitiniphilus eburneus TaxID=2571148 RepID=A0A4U0PZN0_9NEIS|nr:hypothetical protein [Chitiniphilus eburneus]TJZ74085.1 hypothetical protein FAZ21_09010 [Chitiniphilus eburneus]
MEEGWGTTIFSDPAFEHLVAELHFDGNFLLLLDRDDGRDSISISFPDPAQKGAMHTRVKLSDFMSALIAAVENLNR